MNSFTLPFDPAYEFPYTRKLTYLNHASHTPLPTSAYLVLQEYYDELRNGIVDTHRHFAVNDRCREAIAQAVVSNPSQICLTHNNTDGINISLWGLGWREGDEILAPAHEFPSLMYPLYHLAKKHHLTVRLVEEPWTLERLEKELSPRTRALCFSWADFATGEKRDLAGIGALCRARGIRTIVDATQGLGQLALDLSQEPVDAVACGSQKWLFGPIGSGFLWVKKEWIEELDPPFISWLGVKRSLNFEDLTVYDLPPWDDARRFEIGSYPHGDIYSFNAGLRLLLSVGLVASEAQAGMLADMVRSGAAERGIPVVLPEGAQGSAIVSLAMPKAEEVKKKLEEAGVVVSLRAGRIRVSPHCYNRLEDIHRLYEVIDKVIK